MSAGTRAPFVWSAVPRFLHGVVGMTALLSLAFLWPNDHWAVQTVWTLILAYSLFCWTSCFHEAAHHTLCGSKPFSILIGRILGTMMFVPFSVYRESHIRHHAYLNKPTDWELWPYSDPSTSLWFRRLFCWLEIPFGVFTSPYVYSRLYFSPKSPLRHLAVHRTIGWEYVGIVVVWG
ncbi:MAG: fatty acid desaturase, partial [Planctomycetales bacterium 12-60-4]